MMNFPASPTLGQEFTAPNGKLYVWNGYAWAAKPAAVSASVADAAPANPADNSMWWESDTGFLFLFYNDGNTKQWVQVNGTVADPHSGNAWQIRLNPVTISENVSVPAGFNGVTAGPVTIASGITVDVASGSTWVIV